MKNKESAGGIIMNEFNEVVMVFSGTKSWQFPKGNVEEREEYLQTALREIKEETGLTDLKLIKKLPVYTRPSVDEKKQRCLRDIHYFLFKTKKQKITPAFEIIKCEWVPINETADKITYSEDKDFFSKIRRDLK